MHIHLTRCLRTLRARLCIHLAPLVAARTARERLWFSKMYTILSSRVLQTQGNFFLVVCIVSSLEVWCITMPVYRFNLIWSPATRLVNRDRSDKGGPCRYTTVLSAILITRCLHTLCARRTLVRANRLFSPASMNRS